MPALEAEEEVKKGKGLNKFFTPNKFFTRLPLLLAQIKAGNNSYKLKKTSIISFVSSIIKSTNIYIIITEENMVVIAEPKSLYFDFD